MVGVGSVGKVEVGVLRVAVKKAMSAATETVGRVTVWVVTGAMMALEVGGVRVAEKRSGVAGKVRAVRVAGLETVGGAELAERAAVRAVAVAGGVGVAEMAEVWAVAVMGGVLMVGVGSVVEVEIVVLRMVVKKATRAVTETMGGVTVWVVMGAMMALEVGAVRGGEGLLARRAEVK